VSEAIGNKQQSSEALAESWLPLRLKKESTRWERMIFLKRHLSSFSAQDHENGFCEDVDVDDEASVLDIVEVILQFFNAVCN